ncbi:MAG: NAD-dependent epimerase/dehydratase family protein [Candidatus Methylopumilus sp.]|nr:NAD-dependent epimerase/dehydratase family protein [Candidatus Methylopumilus sp.]
MAASPKKNKIVALTGATGFIGTALIKQLQQAGWQVKALYRPKPGRSPISSQSLTWVAGELSDLPSLNSLMADADAVIHCAGAVRGVTQADFDLINEIGARHVAEVAAAQNKPPRLLLISSLAARMPELSHYAGSKMRGELAIKNSPLRWTIFRPPAVYGPGDRELLPLFQSMAKGLAPLPAGANGRFSIIHVDDLAAAMVHCLGQDAGDGKTFELDDGHSGGYDWPSVIKIAQAVLRDGSKIRRLPIPIGLLKLVAWTNFYAAQLLRYAPMLTPGKIREITHSDWLCDNNDITRITGWQPTCELAQGLAGLFDKHH